MNIKNIWILPFLGGLLSLIVLIIPTASSYFLSEEYELTRHFWLWGLFYGRLYIFERFDTETFFGLNIFAPEIFIPALLATILIFVSARSCIKTARRLRKGERSFSEIKKAWIVAGILYFTSAMIYVVGMQVGFSLYEQRIGGSSVNFWQNYVPNFGIIAPFISGFLVIVGVILGTAIAGKEDTPFRNKISGVVS